MSPAAREVARLFTERTGFAPGRDLDDGIARAMAKAGVADPAVYLARVQQDPLTFDDLVAELVVGETYFFREPAAFELIERRIFPELAELRGPFHSVRAWSAGCASGEEPCSVAIALDRGGLAGQVLATDISRAALAAGRRGKYGPWSLRATPDEVVARYFRRAGSTFVLDERVRARVRYEHLNLAEDAFPSIASGVWGLDLILCRNVFIYLARDVVERISRGLAASLAPGGWLLLGASDPLLPELPGIEPVVTPAGTAYRRQAVLHVHAPPREERRQRIEPPPPPLRAVSGPVRRDPLAEAREALSRGEYAAVLERIDPVTSREAAPIAVRAVASLHGPAAGARACAEAARAHPLAEELHLLHAALLLESADHGAAAAAVRRALYLDRTLAIAHFLEGTIAAARGDAALAARAYRTAHDLASALAPDALLPHAEGERAGALAHAASAQLALLAR